ncbi:MAG: sulfotransferase [Bacteroidales bacterium]|nr:sulfotransferase [Bacteroidales bacterium]
MNNSYVTIGTAIGKLFRLFWQGRFALHPKYFFRFFLLFQAAVWSSVFGIIEHFRYKKKIDALPLPVKPVFIVGHWRTGSTFLHQLMSLDDTFITPSVFHVTVPGCFISIEKYYKPVMYKIMDNKRPMDNVKFGPDAPQEDEFALFRLTQNSPLQHIIFPLKKTYFLCCNDNLIPDMSGIRIWEKAMVYFYKKLFFMSKKRILIKNPFHSMRIDIINSIFPDALFIHIYRNPLMLVPSTIRMWDIIANQNKLNNRWNKPGVLETVTLLRKMTDKIKTDLKGIDLNRFIEVKFEDLEENTPEQIKKIYSHLGLNYTQDFEKKILDFIEFEKGYVKNTHTLTDEEIKVIKSEMGEDMRLKGYMD